MKSILLTWRVEPTDAEAFGPFDSNDAAEEYYFDTFDPDVEYVVVPLYSVRRSRVGLDVHEASA